MEPTQEGPETAALPAAPNRGKPSPAAGRRIDIAHARERAMLKTKYRPVAIALWLLGGLGILAAILLRPMPSTRVSLDLYVSALEWESADEPAKDLDWFGLAIAANDSTEFSLPPARITNNPTGGHFVDSTQELVLYPARPYASVQVRKLAFPPQARLQLAQPTAHRLRLAVNAGPPAAGVARLSWTLAFRRRGYDNPRTGRADTLACGDAADARPCELDMQKTLTSNGQYVFYFTRPHPWQGPARLLARTLVFQETNTNRTQAISSVLDGAVRLLDVNSAPIHLSERDVVKVTFEQPVEMFLKSTPQHLVVHVDGVASQVVCGPKILGDADNDQRPLLLHHYYDQSPYIWAILLALVPALLTIYGPHILAKK